MQRKESNSRAENQNRPKTDKSKAESKENDDDKLKKKDEEDKENNKEDGGKYNIQDIRKPNIDCVFLKLE